MTPARGDTVPHLSHQQSLTRADSAALRAQPSSLSNLHEETGPRLYFGAHWSSGGGVPSAPRNEKGNEVSKVAGGRPAAAPEGQEVLAPMRVPLPPSSANAGRPL